MKHVTARPASHVRAATFSPKCAATIRPLRTAASRRDKVNRVCRRTRSRSTDVRLIRHPFESGVRRASSLTVDNYSKA